MSTTQPQPVATFGDTRTWSAALPHPDLAADLLPAELLAAWKDFADLKKKAEAARTAYGMAHAAIDAAGKADVTDTAAALRAGKDDPGLVHTTRAKAEAENAHRVAEATARAAYDASIDFAKACHRLDRATIVADLTERADAAEQEARDRLAEAREARDRVAALRNLALFADKAPDYWRGVSADASLWHVIHREFDKDLKQLNQVVPYALGGPAQVTATAQGQPQRPAA